MLVRKSFAAETRNPWFLYSGRWAEVLDNLKLGSSLALFCFITLLSLGTARTYAGGFITAPTYPAGNRPRSVAVGDFNEDGILDLVVVNVDDVAPFTRSRVSILLGKGDGSFHASQSYLVDGAPNFVAVGDFNGDRHSDLVVTASGLQQDTVNVLLGNGDGTFQAAQSFAAGPGTQIAVADFNGDGILDLAVTNFYEGLRIFFGNGDGTFHSDGVAYSTSGFMAVGDFNGDGHTDLAVGQWGEGTVSIFLGNGDGTFQAAQSYAAAHPWSVAVGDFNGDGILDLVVANYSEQAAGMSVLLGNGDGTFQAAQSYATGLPSYSVAVGDFNGDGFLDIVLGGGSTVSVLLGNGDGTFQAAQSYAAGSGWSTPVAVGDFNRDGILDIVAANEGSGTVSIFLGKGDGTFPAAACGLLPGRSMFGRYSMALGDFNGDGIPDLAVANRDTGKVNILLGKGDGTFAPGQSYTTGHSPSAVAVGDFDRDGRLDIAVVVDDAVDILLGHGDGTFQAPQGYAVATGVPTSLAVGDFNGDGIPDLVVVAGDFIFSAGTLSVLLGNGDGTFQTALTMEAGYAPNSVAVGDFNGDGNLDVVTTNLALEPRSHFIDENDVRVFLGKGDGTFHAPYTCVVSPQDSGPVSVAVGDFNGDGIPDLVVANNRAYVNGRSNTVSVLLGKGDGTFRVHQYQVGFDPQSVAIGDFNGDGIPDVAVSGTGLSILLGNGDGSFQAAQHHAAGPGGQIAVADLNNDGLPDLLLTTRSEPGVLTVLLNAP